MSLQKNPHSATSGPWLTLAALALAALACVQLVIGSTPFVWLLAACVAVWALLVQASHLQEHHSVRVRSSRYQARSERR